MADRKHTQQTDLQSLLPESGTAIAHEQQQQLEVTISQCTHQVEVLGEELRASQWEVQTLTEENAELLQVSHSATCIAEDLRAKCNSGKCNSGSAIAFDLEPNSDAKHKHKEELQVAGCCCEWCE